MFPQDDEIDDPADSRSDDIVDGLLDDADDKEDDEQQEDTSEDQEQEDEDVESEDAEDQAEEEEDPADAEDYEKPLSKEKPKSKKAKDEEKEEESENEEEVPEGKKETIAQKQARENGRLLKTEKIAHLTTRNELTAASERIKELESENATLKKVKVRPIDDEEYKSLHDKVLARVEDGAERIKGGKDVEQRFPGLVNRFLKARSAGDQRKAQMKELKTFILENCVKSDVPPTEWDEDERASADETAEKILDLVRNNADDSEKALSIADRLKADAESGSYELSAGQYNRDSKELKEFVDGLGELADDVVEANPYALETLVATLIKENPKAAARAKKAKKDVLEVFAGQRPLTKAEVDKMKAEGIDVPKFEKERSKAHKELKSKMAAYLFTSLMTRAESVQAIKELAEIKGKKKDDSEEKEALFTIARNNKPGKRGPKNLNDPKKAKFKHSATAAILEDEDYRFDQDD